MALQATFSHLWQQEEHSDVQLVLRVEDTVQGSAANSDSSSGSIIQHSNHQTLQTLPAHAAILSCSPFFRAQLARWQKTQGGDGAASASPPQLVLTLQHVDQQPAALTVLQALYCMKPVQQLLAEQPHEQLLHTALLADMWELPDISQAAVWSLEAAAQDSRTGMSAEAVKQLWQMQAYPDSFQLLLKATVFGRFGDLEAVWANAGLREELMHLSLTAMEGLLSYDQLKVASEDTVLYTAQKYVDLLPDPTQKQAAKQRLAPLIRCSHLSLYWLTASACSDNAPDLLLGSLMPQLKRLVMLRVGGLEDSATAKQLQKDPSLIPDAPASWLLGKRASKQVSRVQVSWELGVDELKQAAQRSAREQRLIKLCCPLVSPPLGGMEWGITCYCECDAAAGGSIIGLYIGPANAVPGTVCSWSMAISVAGGPQYSGTTPLVPAGTSRGWSDFFKTGPMAGGWNGAAWAAKGLPTSGKLVITGTVSEVAHSYSADSCDARAQVRQWDDGPAVLGMFLVCALTLLFFFLYLRGTWSSTQT